MGSDPVQGGGATGVAAAPGAASAKASPQQPVPWSVVLLDDDDHTYEYVMDMMQRLFGHTVERAYTIAKTVDSQGRAVCLTTHRELAELKREQILSFGADPLLARSAGSMSAIIEPAHGPDDPGGDDGRAP